MQVGGIGKTKWHYALVRAASALMPTPGPDRLSVSHKGVEKSRHGTHECVRHFIGPDVRNAG